MDAYEHAQTKKKPYAALSPSVITSITQQQQQQQQATKKKIHAKPLLNPELLMQQAAQDIDINHADFVANNAVAANTGFIAKRSKTTKTGGSFSSSSKQEQQQQHHAYTDDGVSSDDDMSHYIQPQDYTHRQQQQPQQQAAAAVSFPAPRVVISEEELQEAENWRSQREKVEGQKTFNLYETMIDRDDAEEEEDFGEGMRHSKSMTPESNWETIRRDVASNPRIDPMVKMLLNQMSPYQGISSAWQPRHVMCIPVPLDAFGPGATHWKHLPQVSSYSWIHKIIFIMGFLNHRASKCWDSERASAASSLSSNATDRSNRGFNIPPFVTVLQEVPRVKNPDEELESKEEQASRKSVRKAFSAADGNESHRHELWGYNLWILHMRNPRGFDMDRELGGMLERSTALYKEMMTYDTSVLESRMTTEHVNVHTFTDTTHGNVGEDGTSSLPDMAAAIRRGCLDWLSKLPDMDKKLIHHGVTLSTPRDILRQVVMPMFGYDSDSMIREDTSAQDVGGGGGGGGSLDASEKEFLDILFPSFFEIQQQEQQQQQQQHSNSHENEAQGMETNNTTNGALASATLPTNTTAAAAAAVAADASFEDLSRRMLDPEYLRRMQTDGAVVNTNADGSGGANPLEDDWLFGESDEEALDHERIIQENLTRMHIEGMQQQPGEEDDDNDSMAASGAARLQTDVLTAMAIAAARVNPMDNLLSRHVISPRIFLEPSHVMQHFNREFAEPECFNWNRYFLEDTDGTHLASCEHCQATPNARNMPCRFDSSFTNIRTYFTARDMAAAEAAAAAEADAAGGEGEKGAEEEDRQQQQQLGMDAEVEKVKKQMSSHMTQHQFRSFYRISEEIFSPEHFLETMPLPDVMKRKLLRFYNYVYDSKQRKAKKMEQIRQKLAKIRVEGVHHWPNNMDALQKMEAFRRVGLENPRIEKLTAEFFEIETVHNQALDTYQREVARLQACAQMSSAEGARKLLDNPSKSVFSRSIELKFAKTNIFTKLRIINAEELMQIRACNREGTLEYHEAMTKYYSKAIDEYWDVFMNTSRDMGECQVSSTTSGGSGGRRRKSEKKKATGAVDGAAAAAAAAKGQPGSNSTLSRKNHIPAGTSGGADAAASKYQQKEALLQRANEELQQEMRARRAPPSSQKKSRSNHGGERDMDTADRAMMDNDGSEDTDSVHGVGGGGGGGGGGRGRGGRGGRGGGRGRGGRGGGRGGVTFAESSSGGRKSRFTEGSDEEDEEDEEDAPPEPSITMGVRGCRAHFLKLEPSQLWVESDIVYADLTPFGNFITHLQSVADMVFNIYTNFGLFYIAWLTAMSSCYYSFDIKPNLAVTGGTGKGKSYIFGLIEQCMYFHGCHNVQHLTKKAFSGPQDWSDCLIIIHEMILEYLGIDAKGKEVPADEGLKNRITNPYVATIASDPTGRSREANVYYTRVMHTYIWGQNESIALGTPMSERVIDYSARDSSRYYRTAMQCHEPSEGSLMEQCRQLRFHEMQLRHMYCTIWEKAIESKAMPQIDMSVCDLMGMEVFTHLSAEYAVPYPTERKQIMIRTLARTATIMYAIEVELFSTVGIHNRRFNNMPKTFDQHTLQRLMQYGVVTEEIYGFVLTLCQFMVVPQWQSTIARAMARVLGCLTPDEPDRVLARNVNNHLRLVSNADVRGNSAMRQNLLQHKQQNGKPGPAHPSVGGGSVQMLMASARSGSYHMQMMKQVAASAAGGNGAMGPPGGGGGNDMDFDMAMGGNGAPNSKALEQDPDYIQIVNVSGRRMKTMLMQNFQDGSYTAAELQKMLSHMQNTFIKTRGWRTNPQTGEVEMISSPDIPARRIVAARWDKNPSIDGQFDFSVALQYLLIDYSHALRDSIVRALSMGNASTKRRYISGVPARETRGPHRGRTLWEINDVIEIPSAREQAITAAALQQKGITLTPSFGIKNHNFSTPMQRRMLNSHMPLCGSRESHIHMQARDERDKQGHTFVLPLDKSIETLDDYCIPRYLLRIGMLYIPPDQHASAAVASGKVGGKHGVPEVATVHPVIAEAYSKMYCNPRYLMQRMCEQRLRINPLALPLSVGYPRQYIDETWEQRENYLKLNGVVS